ncbi:MAG: DNA topoisomerase, partial [Mycobacteriales bacterium]
MASEPGPAARKRAAGGRALVIVESPAKARTIGRYLGDGFVVESSIGHIRDLPRNAADVPTAHKGEPWARLGVDVDNDFKPLYVISADKRKQVAKLRALLKQSSELYLATDEDREGESIAWHLSEVLSPPAAMPVRRMVFHEITERAIRRALDEPRDLDRRLVDAQEARRILDRLYGYEVSPVLWKKVLPGLSAGRVQSVATRAIVERERERMAFRAAGYWDIEGLFAKSKGDGATDGPSTVSATLVALDGKRLATGKDFGATGATVRDDLVVLDESA